MPIAAGTPLTDGCRFINYHALSFPGRVLLSYVDLLSLFGCLRVRVLPCTCACYIDSLTYHLQPSLRLSNEYLLDQDQNVRIRC